MSTATAHSSGPEAGAVEREATEEQAADQEAGAVEREGAEQEAVQTAGAQATDADAAPGGAPAPAPAPSSASHPDPLADLPDDPDALVHLDRLGEVRVPWEGAPAKVLRLGLSETAVGRLHDSGQYELYDDLEALPRCDLVAISTRLPRTELRNHLRVLGTSAQVPIVAVVHTGGEAAAVEVLRAGGIGVVAEGNEGAIRSYLEGRAYDQSMVETYERQAGPSGAGDPSRARDKVTNLPTATAYKQRIEHLLHGGDVPRVARARILHLGEVGERISAEAAALLRRRLSLSFRQLVHREGGELYALDDDTFGIISVNLSPNRTEQLARQMMRVTESYAPLSNRLLALTVGHAGPEASTELAPLDEIAKRALEVASVEKRSAVVSAERLALGVSATTELEAAQRAVAFVEEHDLCGPGHSHRIADWATAIGAEQGFEGTMRSELALAALLHDAGKVSLPLDCLTSPSKLSHEQRMLYRSHPDRGASWLRTSAGDVVAAAIRSHQERWDGSGYPDGLVGEEIPTAARIIRYVDALDELLQGADEDAEGPLDLPDALDELDRRAGSELDPELVPVARRVLTQLAAREE